LRADDRPPKGLRAAIDEWLQGRKERIPLCCRARYCFDVLLGGSPATKRPSAFDGIVPCNLIHRVTPQQRATWQRWQAEILAGRDAPFCCQIEGCEGESCERPDHQTLIVEG